MKGLLFHADNLHGCNVMPYFTKKTLSSIFWENQAYYFKTSSDMSDETSFKFCI